MTDIRAALEAHPVTFDDGLYRCDHDRQQWFETWSDYVSHVVRNASPAASPEPERCASCNGTLWVDDENWAPGHPRAKRKPHDGLIPCGACNEGGWDAPWPAPDAPPVRALRDALLDDIDTMFGPIQFGHGGTHQGIGTKDCPRDSHHHHDERCVSIRARLDAIIAAARADERTRLASAVETFLREQRVDMETNRCQCEDAYPWDGIHREPCLWHVTHGLRAALAEPSR